MKSIIPAIEVKLRNQIGGTSIGIAGIIQPESLVEKCSRPPPTSHASEAIIPFARDRGMFRAFARAARTSSFVMARRKTRQYQSGFGPSGGPVQLSEWMTGSAMSMFMAASGYRSGNSRLASP